MPLAKPEGRAERFAVQYLGCCHGWSKRAAERHPTGTPQAFLAEYTKWPLFQTGGGGRSGGGSTPDLGEFTEAREAVLRLSAEYASFETAHPFPQVPNPLTSLPLRASPPPPIHTHPAAAHAYAGILEQVASRKPFVLTGAGAQFHMQSVWSNLQRQLQRKGF